MTSSTYRSPVNDDPTLDISLVVNGRPVEASVSPRLLLSDFLRHHLGLTGTHVGCEHGVCGACTVHIDGRAARSCLTLAVQLDGATVRTVEDLEGPDGSLSPVQAAFRDCHGLQCGFCTPGFLMSVTALLDEDPDVADASDAEIRERIAGNLCRCTGYQGIVAATRQAAETLRDAKEQADGTTQG
ncbi:2Fe-2S iron-sulfur cluster binding domain-containing protein [Pimelobacter simplex]|uniref:Carbon monoxide dehydrogenase small chain n=1 Tax=Nocardioides simplex TaxID=2045 RepID=A0A0A1DS16_NOCSI|nr:(2Fe-2S)-binding protein [Pimelobacter simplex]AIY20211.2 Carbon monoxide dehydrogenase small chain [Pimelobacter simplex]MCG8149625.1 2Fe-2S iron-sulfur cluster binding domain-containing protein [Pimelobacter simplex]GEB16011.1 (2Fe-2S)-binding protein [Pimelobacter simplex]SFM82261.1 carbon-monoxide dehydrogenase small subunit [Pimelobacter simplex]